MYSEAEIPEMDHAKIPKGYTLFYSNHHGSENWDRYGRWNGRTPHLAVGDVVHESYREYGTADRVSRFFLVLEDAHTHLWLLPIKSVPSKPVALLRRVLKDGIPEYVRMIS